MWRRSRRFGGTTQRAQFRKQPRDVCSWTHGAAIVTSTGGLDGYQGKSATSNPGIKFDQSLIELLEQSNGTVEIVNELLVHDTAF